MTDSSPTYSLSDLKKKVEIAHYAITRAASEGAGAMGMDEEDIKGCIQALTAADFYKTMPSEKVPDTYQDVYKTRWYGKPVYAKFSLSPHGGKAVVVSFKRDQTQPPGENEP